MFVILMMISLFIPQIHAIIKEHKQSVYLCIYQLSESLTVNINFASGYSSIKVQQKNTLANPEQHQVHYTSSPNPPHPVVLNDHTLQ